MGVCVVRCTELLVHFVLFGDCVTSVQHLQAELRAQNGTLSTKQLETVHFMPRNRSALKITEAELKLIASAAIIGDSSQPVNG